MCPRSDLEGGNAPETPTSKITASSDPASFESALWGCQPALGPYGRILDPDTYTAERDRLDRQWRLDRLRRHLADIAPGRAGTYRKAPR